MKCTSKFFASFAACAALLICAAPICASADTDKSAQADLFSSDPFVAFSALGYTPDQIQTILTSSVAVDQYLAYCNYDSNIGSTGVPRLTFTVNRPSWIACNGFVYGSLFTSIFSEQIYNHPTDNPLRVFDSQTINYTTNTGNLNEYQFPNIIRFKYSGYTSTSNFTVTCAPYDTSPAYLKGTVEAGNVSRYISGSTDTGSIINSSDATLVLQHFGDMMAGIADPNWTYAASIAADVNCDNQVNATDAMLISNRVAGISNYFWDPTPIS